MQAPPQVLLQACGLPLAWARQPAWRILEVGRCDAVGFLTCWAAWQADPHRPPMLHYVAIIPAPLRALPASGQPNADVPTLGGLQQALDAQCFGLCRVFTGWCLSTVRCC